MASTTKIRPACDDDYHDVCELFHALDEHHVELRPQEFQRFQGPVRPHEHYLNMLADPDNFFLVAEHEGKLTGFINGLAGTSSPFPIFRQDAFVSVVNVYVCQEQRGSGLGRSLVNEAMKWGMKRGVEKLRLDVIADNKEAIDFYKRLGFVNVRVRMEVTESALKDASPQS